MDDLAAPAPPSPYRLWGRGFRPFFLAVGLYAGLATTVWLAIWGGLIPAPRWLTPMAWHGHEMLFGVVAAAIAGFLLTSTPVWTGRRAWTDRPLQGLVAVWALGRVAMLAAGALPTPLVAVLDLAFLPLLALALAHTLWRSGQARNQALVGVVALLALANAAVHAEALELASGIASRALRLAVDLIVVLIVVVGGRITPAFTTNALQRRGVAAEVRTRPALDRAAVAMAALVAAAGVAVGPGVVRGVLALAAGIAVAARMAGWQTRRTGSDPLLWSLHAGLAWAALGLLLVGVGDLAAPVASMAGLHALAAGAMGSMILAVMTRVALGHTGRPLVLPPGAVYALVLVHAGAAARVTAALAPASALPLLVAGGLLWTAGFWLFAIVHAPILTRARVDGREG